ncbi:hypothetical protein [Streptomyces sp. NPDC040750]|uniref:hypothetical protein n=1 Tax=Streptomyces sp. NPDC040750 TaxID=3154491 RepID=UPI0033CD4473
MARASLTEDLAEMPQPRKPKPPSSSSLIVIAIAILGTAVLLVDAGHAPMTDVTTYTAPLLATLVAALVHRSR